MRNNLSFLVLGSTLAAVFASGAIADGETPDMKINDFTAMLPPAPTVADGTVPRILKWKDGKKGVFLLAFDDGCKSQLDNAIPLLRKYGAVGTFYPIIEGGFFKAEIRRWKEVVDDPCVVFGNHTLTHGEFPDGAKFDAEVKAAQDWFRELQPKAKWPRLISFGQPGVKVWKVSKEEYSETLARYNLIDRPPFWGASIHVKTVPEAEKLVDDALAQGKMSHLDFHGVGGDWLAPPTEFLEGLLKKLLAERDNIWQASAIDYHKYQAERDASTIEIVSKDAGKVTLRLSSTADPEFYDLPLTVEAEVPADWALCHVAAEGLGEVDAKVVAGRVRFYALPGTIVLTQGK